MKANALTLIGLILAVVLIVGGLFVMFQKINDDIKQHNAEETEIVTTEETQRESEPTETELKFEPIETETEVETTTETETEVVTETEIETEAETEIEIVTETEAAPVETTETIESAYNDDDLMLLARIVTNEAGSDWCTDEHQRAVASVVLNRVNDARFPDTVYGVISQGWNGECPIQYAVGTPERFFSLQPSDRALANAAYVLEHGSTVDSAIWQAEFVQGEIVAVFETPYSTTYICK